MCDYFHHLAALKKATMNTIHSPICYCSSVYASDTLLIYSCVLFYPIIHNAMLLFRIPNQSKSIIDTDSY